MWDGLERGELAGWEKASAWVLERHSRKPDPGRWRSNDEGNPECRGIP